MDGRGGGRDMLQGKSQDVRKAPAALGMIQSSI